MLALILILSIILRDTKGARLNAVKVFGPPVDLFTDKPPVAAGDNVTDATGLVNCKLVKK